MYILSLQYLTANILLCMLNDKLLNFVGDEMLHTYFKHLCTYVVVVICCCCCYCLLQFGAINNTEMLSDDSDDEVM